MTPPAGILDPGLQPERTTLAWQRTVLSLVLGAIVLAVGQLGSGSPWLTIAGTMPALMALAPGVIRPRQEGSSRPLSTWTVLSRTAALVAALAAVAIASAAQRLVG